jgi:hypothetical protein
MVGFPRLSLALLIYLSTTPLAAQSPTDLMFPGRSGCYIRQYGPDHLARHPEQRVTTILLLAEGSIAEPMLGVWVNVSLRGVPGGEFEALSYCENIEDTLYCGMEGDAGAFTLRPAKDGAVLLEVARYGMSFENERGFETLESDRGDDRSFLLNSAACR